MQSRYMFVEDMQVTLLARVGNAFISVIFSLDLHPHAMITHSLFDFTDNNILFFLGRIQG